MPRYRDKPSTRRTRQLLHLRMAHLSARRLRDMSILALLTALLLLVGCTPGASTIIVVQTATPGALADATASPSASASASPAGTIPTGSATTTPKPASGSGSPSTPTKTPTPQPSTPSVHQVSTTTTLYGGDTGPATVSCPNGELALDGGWSVSAQTVQVLAAYLDGNTWKVSAQPLGHTVSHDVTAYVECLRSAPVGAMVTQHVKDVSGSFRTLMSATVGCAANEHVVGWGFDFVSSGLDLLQAYPVSPGWYLVAGINSAAHQWFAYSYCLSNLQNTVTQVDSGYAPVPQNAAVTLQAHCAANSVAVAGIIAFGEYGPDIRGRLYEMHTASNGWTAAVYGVGAQIVKFQTGALCLSLS